MSLFTDFFFKCVCVCSVVDRIRVLARLRTGSARIINTFVLFTHAQGKYHPSRVPYRYFFFVYLSKVDMRAVPLATESNRGMFFFARLPRGDSRTHDKADTHTQNAGAVRDRRYGGAA